MVLIWKPSTKHNAERSDLLLAVNAPCPVRVDEAGFHRCSKCVVIDVYEGVIYCVTRTGYSIFDL